METPANNYPDGLSGDRLPNRSTDDQSSSSATQREESHTETTGIGLSQAERDARTAADHGRGYLIGKYNINDQAHSDSSVDDFIKTTSNFKHENEQ